MAGKTTETWELAKQHENRLRFSTLFTAQDMNRTLKDKAGIQTAIDWCRRTGVTRVFMETYRDRMTVEPGTVKPAQEAFKQAGLAVSGCVTPTNVGTPSTVFQDGKPGHGKYDACYTSAATQDALQGIFEYTAGLFDEIMIDDFWFTRCCCPDCTTAKGEKSWAEYRTDLLVRLSQERILGPAKKVNPRCRVIVKFPRWYDGFQVFGYDVARETELYDTTWAGTETRDFEDPTWGGVHPYESFFIMRWLTEAGGGKCGGGWFDAFGTSPATYLEQARQTILGGAGEIMLFSYGSLQKGTGPECVAALQKEMPGLFNLAALVQGKPVQGVLAPKPLGSYTIQPIHPDAWETPTEGPDSYIFDHIGMLGIPLVPHHLISTDCRAAFFSVHALKGEGFLSKLKTLTDPGVPVLLTEYLAKGIRGGLDLHSAGIKILPGTTRPHTLIDISDKGLQEIRNALLRPFGIVFKAPKKVSLHLFGEDTAVVENFNDKAVESAIQVAGKRSYKIVQLLPESAPARIRQEQDGVVMALSPRSLSVVVFN